ncbi:MAG: RdgB/HAM1 family non-canonical purine NTP pyrophosphatase [Chitinophagaceae bacterium]
MNLVFATNNNNKVLEIRKLLPHQYNITTLKEAGIYVDIPEPHHTLHENAIEKVDYIFNTTKQNAFAEDTGLHVEALNGEPGVKSARYAGEEKSDANNIKFLLHKLELFQNKSAYFKTVIALRLNGELHLFEGVCEGKIIATPTGENGFGYDPIFVPNGSTKTFAEMSLDEKNLFSHRKKATQKLIEFLNKH